MDYLRLGELRLTTVGNVTSFEETTGYNYAAHSIATGAQVLQSMGRTLSAITLGISLRAALGDNVPEMLALIDRLCRSGTPQRFVFANGVYKGDYVITERGVTITATDARGEITAADFSLSLLEYADRVVIAERNCEQRPQSETQSTRKTRTK